MAQCNEEHGVVVGETFVSKPVQDCMRVVYDWMYEQMYARHTVWNTGDQYDRMHDASDFLNQFLLGNWEG